MWALVESFVNVNSKIFMFVYSSGILWTLTVKSSCIWDNLDLFPMSMYLVFLTFRVNLFVVSHNWIKFIS